MSRTSPLVLLHRLPITATPNTPTPTTPSRASIAQLTLNHPEKLNPMDVAMGEAFEAAVDEVARDASVRCVVVTGAGRAFSAGGDLAFLEDRAGMAPAENADVMARFYFRYLRARARLDVPMVAALNGPAVGAGLLVGLSADIRVTHRASKLSIPFCSLGITAGMGATHLLPLAVGHQHAARLLLTGETITGDEALRIGMVAYCEDTPEQVLPRALAVAQSIAAQSPVAVQGMTRMLRDRQDVSHGSLLDALAEESRVQSRSYAQPDFKEGIKAKKEKREPKF
jgi:enoyl-CoA hydratase/carnithine racemase